MCRAMDEMLKDSKAECQLETCVQLVNDGDISLDRALESFICLLISSTKRKLNLRANKNVFLYRGTFFII